MVNDINVKPTPIQRNALDVATELTLKYYSMYSTESVEEMQEIFLKFYSVAEAGRILNYAELKEYMPEKMKQIIDERSRRY